MGSAAGTGPPPSPDLPDQIIETPAGRKISFAEFGDPAGYPVIIFHGFPGCRLDPWPFHQPLAAREVRLIVPDRPGYGHSSFEQDRLIKDYPTDILALVDHLGLAQYAILGVSGGGPYALACARYIPQPERVSAIGLLSPAGPWEFDVKENGIDAMVPKAKPLRTVSRLGAMAVRYIPTLLSLVLKLGVGLARWLVTKEWVVRRIEKTYERDLGRQPSKNTETDPDHDTPPLSPADQAYQAISTFLQITRQGVAPIMQEARLLESPWGFDPSEIRYDGIRIWHGVNDVHAPIDGSRWIASKLPNAQMEEYAFDHPEMLALLDVIVDKLVTLEMRAERGATKADAT